MISPDNYQKILGITKYFGNRYTRPIMAGVYIF